MRIKQRRYAFLISLFAMAVAPVLFLWLLGNRSRRLFEIREPHVDLFFFHDARLTYVNLFFLSGAMVLFYWRTKPSRRIDTLWEKYRSPLLKYLPWAFLLVASALAMPIYQNVPLSMDEYAAVFQAEAFSQGSIFGQVRPELLSWVVPPRLQNYFFTTAQSGRIVETYLPGYALLLAPFIKFHLGFLFNAFAGALILALLIRFAQRLFGDDAALWVALLAISSPVFWVNSVSFYSLNCRLLFNLLFLFYLWPLPSGMTQRRAVLAGLYGGMAAFTHHPFPHEIFALPWLGYFIYRQQTRRFFWSLALGYLPFVLLSGGWTYLIYRMQTKVATSPSHGKFTYAWDLSNSTSLPTWEGYTFILWTISLCKLVLWSTPGFWFFFSANKSIKSPFLRLSLASFLLTFLAYSLAKNRVAQGFGWGHRYTYAAIGVAILAAGYWLSREENRAPFRAAALFLVLAGLFVITPLRLLQTRRFIASQQHKLPCLPADVPQVCFVASLTDYYMGDRVQNDPFLTRPRLIFHSAGKELDARMMGAQFPNYELQKGDVQNGVWTPRAKP